MEIAQNTTTTSTTTKADSGTDPAPKQQISADFETFLRMLAVQMENQDPLNPVDSSDYATQLATFSGVEQAVLTNDLLTNLSAQMNLSGMGEMAAWVGKEARVAAPAHFDGSPITLSPNPEQLADEAYVVVSDKNGIEVQRFDIPVSADPIQWAGVGADGAPFPAGVYSFELVNMAEDQELSRSTVEVYSTVTEVRSTGGQTMLILDGEVAVASADITALRNPLP